MKTIYLENTSGNHNKFYHMIENKDGASFTASWGRIGTTGRTQIYGMNEWDKIYNSKINKGYKSQYHNKPNNWIQGMSVAQRKKQGITTVQPLVQPKKAKKKTANNSTHKNKLVMLTKQLKNWTQNAGKNYALDSMQGRVYEADLDRVKTLIDELDKQDKNSLSKEEMFEMNLLYRTYGGIRKNNSYYCTETGLINEN